MSMCRREDDAMRDGYPFRPEVSGVFEPIDDIKKFFLLIFVAHYSAEWLLFFI